MRILRQRKIEINGVFGIATNDVDYQVKVSIDGKIAWECPCYIRWRGMIERCYDEKLHKKRPTYIDCSVAEEWLLFSSFKDWMERQDWKDKHLDKDILFVGNKIYSPDTCVFVHPAVNAFTTDRVLDRGEYPLGVHLHIKTGKFKAQCNNPFTMKREHIGLFHCANEAHLAWKARKHLYACQLADSELVDDPRVAEALRKRYI
jgi:hypothetical protein